MSNQFRDRLQRLHDAHQRGRDSEGGPSGVYGAGGENGVSSIAPVKKRGGDGWEALGAVECDDFEEPYYLYSTRCDPDYRQGEWTIEECLAAEHAKLCVLEEDVPVGVEAGQILYMDTETDGLGQKAVAFMVGIGFWEDGAFKVEHLLLDELAGERSMLKAFAERLRRYDLLVTFNGKRFDVPLLQRRYAACGLESPFLNTRHLDLLPLARRVFVGRKRYRLASLERDILNFRRVDDVPGRDIPPLWRRFCRDKNARPLRGVLEHNRHDIVSMAALVARICGGEKRSETRESETRELASRGEIASRLERSYRLRGEFAKSDERGVKAPGPIHQSDSEKRETRAGAKAGQRVKELRGAARVLIDRAMWQAAFPLICEVAALAPEDRWGLQMLARFYRQDGQKELAEAIDERVRAGSALDDGDA